MTRLSLAMIVRDEAARLQACLDSVRRVVDEVVVVDTGSTDSTPALARSLGARVCTFPWADDFSAARNFSLAQCEGDWVLILDADEQLDAASGPVLRAFVEGAPGEGALLTVRNHLPSGAFRGIHGGANPNPGGHPGTEDLAYCTEFLALRLARRAPGLAFSGRVHELLEPSFDALGWRALPIPALIHHFGKASPTRELAKQERYFRLAQLDAAEHPGVARFQYNLMQEGAMVEAWADCLAAADAYLALEPHPPLKAYLDGARALVALHRPAEALAFLDRTPEELRQHPTWLTARAQALADLGRGEEATAQLLAVIDRNPHCTEAFLALADLLWKGSDRASARRVLEAGLDQNPRDLLLWTALVGLGSREGDLGRAARDAWQALAAFPAGGEGIWHQLVIRALLALGDRPGAAEVLRRGLEAFPGHPDLEALRGAVG